MTTSLQTRRNRVNRGLKVYNGYFPEIPLSDIFAVVRDNLGEVVQEDGTLWSGLLCGEVGTVHFTIRDCRSRLHLTWFTMPSGKYEVTVYVA